MDRTLDADPRKKRIEDLLYIIGGCEVAERHNKPGQFGSYPPLGREFARLKQTYLKKLERVINGLPED